MKVRRFIRLNQKPVDFIHVLFRLLIGAGEILDGLIEIASLGYLVGYFGLYFTTTMVSRNHKKKQRFAEMSEQ